VLINEDMNDANSTTGMTIPSAAPFCTAQLDQAVSNNNETTEAVSAGDDNGDHVNLTWAGYAAMAEEFNPANSEDSPCALAPNVYPWDQS
jgi:hypothetical protein